MKIEDLADLARPIAEIPEISHTKNGTSYAPRMDVWSFRDGTDAVYADFQPLKISLSAHLLGSYKLALIWMLANRSSASLAVATRAFTNLLTIAQANREFDTPIDEITSSMLLNYRASKTCTQSNWDTLKVIVIRWHDQGHPGITRDAYDVIKKITRIKAGKTNPVETLCPRLGPFSAMERDTLDAKLNEAFGKGDITKEDYLLVTLYQIFGSRPAQFSLLKVRDVIREQRADGSFAYALKIPSKKKRKADRKMFKTRMLTDEFGEFLHGHAQETGREYSQDFQKPGDAPLFPAQYAKIPHSEELKHHLTAAAMGGRVQRIGEVLHCVSERTGAAMNVTPVRFRRTLGTVLAEEGQPPAVIAEALDHASLASVACYTAITGKLHQRIDKALSVRLAPIAQAFVGILVDKATEPANLKQVRDIRVNGTFEPVGNCGKYGFCKSAAPLACYTCVSFRPFLDAPHEALLDFLLEEHRRLSLNLDQTMASVHERTIVALAQVVTLCQEVQRD